MADRTGLVDFETNFEVKNGQIGSQTVLNKAVHEVKIELDTLWDWVADASDTLPTGSVAELLINDVLPYSDPGATSIARSANYIGLRISNDPGNISSTLDTWCTSQIYSQIKNASLDGGSW